MNNVGFLYIKTTPSKPNNQPLWWFSLLAAFRWQTKMELATEINRLRMKEHATSAYFRLAWINLLFWRNATEEGAILFRIRISENPISVVQFHTNPAKFCCSGCSAHKFQCLLFVFVFIEFAISSSPTTHPCICQFLMSHNVSVDSIELIQFQSPFAVSLCL